MLKNIFRKNQTRKLKVLQTCLQFFEQILDEKENDDDQYEISMEEEKKNSLAILDQITNVQSSASKAKTNMIRFDPSKTEHRVFEMESERKKNLNSSKEIQTKPTTGILI